MDDTNEIKRDGEPKTLFNNIDNKESDIHSEEYENFCYNATPQEPDCKSVSEERQVCCGNPVAVCLGMLSALLLAVIISLCIKHDAERNQLWSQYYNMSVERENIQANFYNITMERDRLKEKLSNMKVFCPTGWVRFFFSCYYISTVKNTWEDSKKECRMKGSNLVIINSRDEQVYVSGLARNFWIGLTDTEREGYWKWVDGTSLKSGYWMLGEPNTYRYWNSGLFIRSSCVQSDSISYRTLSSWKATRCDYQRVWICEKIALCHF